MAGISQGRINSLKINVFEKKINNINPQRRHFFLRISFFENIAIANNTTIHSAGAIENASNLESAKNMYKINALKVHKFTIVFTFMKS